MPRRRMTTPFTTTRVRMACLAITLTAVLSLSLVADAFTGGSGSGGRQAQLPVSQAGTAVPDASAAPSPAEPISTPADEPSADPVTPPANPANSEITVDEPTAGIIAQGLAFWEGGEAVWRVRQITVAADAASAPAAFYGFILQRDGVSIVRNDVTNRRARLEPGEAAYFSLGDAYTVSPVGQADSVAWLIELTPPDATVDDAYGGEVVYTSDPIDFDEGTFDAELSRNVLTEGATGRIYAGNGPTLLLGSTGALTADDGTDVAELLPADGLTVTSDAVVENTAADPAVYLTAALRDEVIDATAAASAAPGTPAADGTPTAGSTAGGGIPTIADDPGTDSDGDGLTDAQEEALGSSAAVIDSDGDGDDDFSEVAVSGTDPATADTDGDGLLDGDETYIYDTLATSADTDEDGLTDGEEINTYATDPFNPDSDGDGSSDAAEIEAGTAPLDPTSIP